VLLWVSTAACDRPTPSLSKECCLVSKCKSNSKLGQFAMPNPYKAIRRRTNNTGKVYSSEYTEIPKVFFTPHHAGHCCTNVIPGHCFASMHFNNEVGSHCCATVTLVMRVDYATDRHKDGPIRSSSLTLERQEHLKATAKSYSVCSYTSVCTQEKRRRECELNGSKYSLNLILNTFANVSLICYCCSQVLFEGLTSLTQNTRRARPYNRLLHL
jgi:hypothetical protein